MGVINITPDSFSDAGKMISSEKVLIGKIKAWKNLGVNHFDIGAQSTAPTSTPCSASEEWSRLEKYFLPHIDLFDPKDTLSFDTFRCSTMRKVLQFLEENEKKQVNLIFNDVSGKLDTDVLDLLSDFPSLKYVYSHNLCSSRELTHDHMSFARDYSQEGMILTDVIEYFQSAQNLLITEGLINRVFFDPCFGFSKNYLDNIFLLKNIEQIFRSFPKQAWLVGISKKSFLQQLQPDILDKASKQDSSEYLHSILLAQILLKWQAHVKLMPFYNQSSTPKLLLRVHEPLVAHNSTLFVSQFAIK